MNPHAKGLLLAATGILILSPDSLVIRWINSEPYPLVALRALSVALFIFAYLLAVRLFRSPPAAANAAPHPRQWQPLFWYGVFFGLGLFTFPLSIAHTYTANTLTILASTPIFAAIGARIFLSEKTEPMVWLTACVLLVGMAIIFAGDTNLLLIGNAYALLTAFVLAGSTLIIRRYKDLDIFPGLAFGGAWVFAVAGGLAGTAEWQSVSQQDLIWAAVDGSLIVGLSFLLITQASKMIPPAEIGLIFLLEAVLGPLWTWLFDNETPPTKTLLAASLILTMLAIYSVWTYRRTQQLAAPIPLQQK